MPLRLACPATEKSKRSRPALWAVLSYSAVWYRRIFPRVSVLLLSGLALALFATALVLLMAGGRRSAGLTPVLLILVAGLGALRYEINTELLPPNHISASGLDGRKGTFKGRVVTEPERRAQRTSFVVDLEAAETDSALYRVSGRILVSARNLEVGAAYGDRVTLTGRLRLPSGPRNPGSFDYRRFLFLQNIHATLSLSRSVQVVAVEEVGGAWLWEAVVLPIRRSVRQSIRGNLDGAPADLLQGMLLGDKHRISPEVRDSFRRTGLAHALVISGLHVGLVAGVFLHGVQALPAARRPNLRRDGPGPGALHSRDRDGTPRCAGIDHGLGDPRGAHGRPSGRYLQFPRIGRARHPGGLADQPVQPGLPAFLRRYPGHRGTARPHRPAVSLLLAPQ